MKARGVTHVAECGPGRVLTGLVNRIEESLTALPLSSGSMLDQAKAMLAPG
jgi:[acyl-carrier-protein] S-malonyltransferase